MLVLLALLAGAGIFHSFPPVSWTTDKSWLWVNTRTYHPHDRTTPYIIPTIAMPSPDDLTHDAESTIVDKEISSLPLPPVHRPPADPERLSVEELMQLVSTTEGYFTRDWSLGLGWNNMRYIIDSALLQAKLLRRTLIVPSFVYARSCEYDVHVCSDYAPMVNKGDVLGSNEWRGLPIDQQMAWILPINLMINITHLRQSQPVITVSDYLRLHDHDSDSEAPDGQWQRVSYHMTENVLTGKIPELYVIENEWFDPSGTVRVDEMIPRTDEEAYASDIEEGEIYRILKDALLDDQVVMDWNDAQELLSISSDEDMERVIVDNGWEVVHTFKPLLGMEYSKAVVDPIRQITPRKALHGFKNDFEDRKEEVVLLAGEVHYGRKPVCSP